jgi:hypothetical protein
MNVVVKVHECDARMLHQEFNSRVQKITKKNPGAGIMTDARVSENNLTCNCFKYTLLNF